MELRDELDVLINGRLPVITVWQGAFSSRMPEQMAQNLCLGYGKMLALDFEKLITRRIALEVAAVVDDLTKKYRTQVARIRCDSSAPFIPYPPDPDSASLLKAHVDEALAPFAALATKLRIRSGQIDNAPYTDSDIASANRGASGAYRFVAGELDALLAAQKE